MRVSPVPGKGPLSVGAVYQRAALHGRFGGNQTAGIVPSTTEPVILLFHTEEGAQQFYGDGTDANGVYWYSGMGAKGDMDWNYANRAVRDHAADGRDLFLFERVQRQGGYWKFSHVMHCAGWKELTRPDQNGKSRRAFIFGLVPVEADQEAQVVPASIESLRDLAMLTPIAGTTLTKLEVREVYRRSVAVRAYVLVRASGNCEACGAPAPFLAIDGQPFLEAHHVDRLADNGPDRPDRVAAVCPNCHRRCHYGQDASDFNGRLRIVIAEKESAFANRSARS